MARHPPRLWRHYVDDTYIIIKRAHAQAFTVYLNTVEADIKWTTEGEVEMVITEDTDEEIVWGSVEKALTFLDIWSVISSDGSIKTEVFRKETYTDQYINVMSNHPLEHKEVVACTLWYRAEAIVSDPKDIVEEKTHIKQALCWNGYPAWLLEGADTSPQDQPAEEEVE